MWSKAVTLFIAMMLMVPWSGAQSTFGSIVGVVKDPSQSAVAGAQLTLTNLDDRSQRNATSDANGGFEFINLKPAHYELIVHADGFADYRVSSMQLDARQSLRFDVPLKVATSTQTIEVSSDAGPVINTENGTIGDTKDFAQLTGLPVNYRGVRPPARWRCLRPSRARSRTPMAMFRSAADFLLKCSIPWTDLQP